MFAHRSSLIATAIRIGLVLALWTPVIVTESTVSPTLVGKALYARTIIEVLTALWLVLLLVDSTYRPPRSWVLFAFLAWVVASFLSAVFGVDFAHSIWSDYLRMSGVWDLAHWLLFTLVAVSVLRSGQAWRSMLNWNLAVVLSISLFATAQVFNVARFFPYLGTDCRVTSTLGNPSFLAAILAAAVPVSFGLLAQSVLQPIEQSGRRWARRSLRLFWLTTGVLGTMVLFWTGTRGALIGLGGGVIVMALAVGIWGHPKARRPVLAIAGLMLSLLVLPSVVDATVGLPVSPGCETETTSARLTGTVAPLVGDAEPPERPVDERPLLETLLGERYELAWIGLRAFRDRPLLGWGQGNYEYAFNRFAKASHYAYTPDVSDRAHNKPIEELTTKGIVGAASYLLLWLALVWAIVRGRRPPADDVLAYAVLGALGAYFIQNLFLFDTPGALLQWSLLVAWVVGQRRTHSASTSPGVADGEESRRVDTAPGARPLRPPQVLLIASVTIGLILSLYLYSYRPYIAAVTYRQSFIERGSIEERLALAEKSFAMFPGMSPLLRQDSLSVLTKGWQAMQRSDQAAVAQFALGQTAWALQNARSNARLLAVSLAIPEALADTPEAASELDPAILRLQEIAPERLSTQQYLANREVRNGAYREALQRIADFVSQAPHTASSFRAIKERALAGLAQDD